VGTLLFWSVGFALAFGPSERGLFGTKYFFLQNVASLEKKWSITWTFHVTSQHVNFNLLISCFSGPIVSQLQE
jgi:ammonia channel protein AmtB